MWPTCSCPPPSARKARVRITEREAGGLARQVRGRARKLCPRLAVLPRHRAQAGPGDLSRFHRTRRTERTLPQYGPELEGHERFQNAPVPGRLIWPQPEEGAQERIGTVFTSGTYATENGKIPLDLKLMGAFGWTPPKGNPHGAGADKEYPLVLTQGKVVTQWQQTMTNSPPRWPNSPVGA